MTSKIKIDMTSEMKSYMTSNMMLDMNLNVISDIQFPLMPMGVLAPHLRTLDDVVSLVHVSANISTNPSKVILKVSEP